MSTQRGLIQADQDLSDIRALKKLPGFERYFLRRLTEKRDEFAAKVLDEDLSTECREICRQIYQEYKALRNMVDQDEANAVKLLGSQAG